MRIHILGGGWYGCHLAASLSEAGHEVTLHEKAERLFAGASGANPARLHLGFHYPRSKLTRAACQEQHAAFMGKYGHLTRAIPTNLYAIASDDSHVDFGNYTQTLRGELEFITVEDPSDFGLVGIEGAILTGERHIVIREAREYFLALLGHKIEFNSIGPGPLLDVNSDIVIDCTFCARDSMNVDRYEPCITTILEGMTDRALTIMDGPFASLYPWDERDKLLSLTSAKYTPFQRVKTYEEADSIIRGLKVDEIVERAHRMREQLAAFWPESWDRFQIVDNVFGIRAMPASGADARLVDIVKTGARQFRVRAGKIVSIFMAEQSIKGILCSL